MSPLALFSFAYPSEPSQTTTLTTIQSSSDHSAIYNQITDGSQGTLRHSRGAEKRSCKSSSDMSKIRSKQLADDDPGIQKTTPHEFKPRISRTKGHLSKRTAFVREIVKEVSGYVLKNSNNRTPMGWWIGLIIRAVVAGLSIYHAGNDEG